MIRQAKTTNGIVEGVPASDTRVIKYLGIPFAKPPVGDNRWRAPQPADDWEGVYKAYNFAPISVQDTPGIGDDVYIRDWHVDSEIPMSEDCLYLNVWTNAKSDTDNLPVVVWFFGGGFQWGYTAEMELSGERIARQDIVFVSVNYRLAALGFLAHPELTKESPDAPTNFGSLDQKAGLDWVIENIKAFGGDPNNITIAGQSAGGASTISQMIHEPNYNKIKAATIFSGFINDPSLRDPIIIPKTLPEAEQLGIEFFNFIGVKSLEEARKLDAFFIRDKYAEFAMNHDRMSLIIDGKFLVDDPYVLVTTGKYADIPLLSGNTTDEFFGKTDENPPRDVNVVEASVKAVFGRTGELNRKNTYYYRFDGELPGYDNPGTFHSSDLWYFFDTLMHCWRPFEGKHYDLARQMSSYWINFIKTGDPNGKDYIGKDLPEWKPYTASEKNEMEFTKDGSVAKIGNTELIDYQINTIYKSLNL